ncbi:single-stranded-DNA-specific exonuclease RecJ [Reinekea marina]|uniref:Single-stranded-DNA-specific exonuclease RecJ n=1 Tax=Reinekea marina TaxID=1310421 RepID=A0ABV7WNI2_9GAMM|nr:single-stranded-DNA-specific exonuclease RecJ [Reinekea marina]MDN3649861.1 single-stranded-DNA-specific exonuclease RecJ [Reinekea marina]
MSKLNNLSIGGFEIRTRHASDESHQVHQNPLLNRLYLARGVESANQLEDSLTTLLPWQSLKDIHKAADLLQQAKAEHWKVLIVGDYDTDGATSTALAMLGLTEMGLNVNYLLPNRFEYGYGLSPEIVDLALQQSPDLIVTVDNGIASLEGVAKAKAANVKVLITDHHLAAATLPNADAIVNPNQPNCNFESKAACGCTVMFYVLIALRATLRDQGVQPLPNLGKWLDLVALASVADVVPLDANNRKLVQQGIKRIRQGQCRPGIRALFDVAGKDWRQAKSLDMGFVVGPRLNAAGRLDDMTIGVQCLLTENDHEAREIAQQLQDFNVERRQIEQSMVADAQSYLDDINISAPPSGLVLCHNDWHEGVIGILASRVKEKIHRPVIAMAPADNGTLKGSARSIPGVHLRDALDWVSKKNANILIKFGGHAMAAGLTIREESLEEFRSLFEQSIHALADPEALQAHLWTDGPLQETDLNLHQALNLEQAGPWGQAFPEPQFYGEFTIVSQRIVGERHLKLVVKTGQQEIDGIAFNIDTEEWPTNAKQLIGVYQLSCNRFRGQETLQLMFSKIEAR